MIDIILIIIVVLSVLGFYLYKFHHKNDNNNFYDYNAVIYNNFFNDYDFNSENEKKVSLIKLKCTPYIKSVILKQDITQKYCFKYMTIYTCSECINRVTPGFIRTVENMLKKYELNIEKYMSKPKIAYISPMVFTQNKPIVIFGFETEKNKKRFERIFK